MSSILHIELNIKLLYFVLFLVFHLFLSISIFLSNSVFLLLRWLGSRSVSPDTLRCQIREASKSKDKEAIERLIDDAETAKYPELRPDLREARQSLESLGGGQGG